MSSLPLVSLTEKLTEQLAWQMVCDLHSNVPEDQRPLSWSDLSPEQMERALHAAARAHKLLELEAMLLPTTLSAPRPAPEADWPEAKITNPDIANPTGVSYLDCLIHRMLDAQQDLNLVANETMDQSVADASALIDEIEIAIRKFAAPRPAPEGVTTDEEALALVMNVLARVAETARGGMREGAEEALCDINNTALNTIDALAKRRLSESQEVSGT